MSKAKTNKPPANGRDRRREEWLAQLNALIDQIEAWAREFDWSTRRIEKQLDDEAGPYPATGLMLQKEFTRVLLEPMGWSETGGSANLYLMPAYDDLANLYFENGAWQVYYQSPETPRKLPAYKVRIKPLSKKLFRDVIEGMNAHAAKVQ